MISIVLNGEHKTIAEDSTIEHLLQNLEIENKRLAVEVNQQIVPRSNFNDHILSESDQVEIVQAIGGG